MEYDGLLTMGAGMYAELARVGLRIHAMRAPRTIDEEMAATRQLDALWDRQEQLVSGLMANMAVIGRLMLTHPELDRVIDKSNAPTVDVFRQEQADSDSYQSRLEGLDDLGAAELLRGEIDGVLNDISEDRNKLVTGDISPLALDRLVTPMLASLGGNEALSTAARQRVDDHKAARRNRNLLIGVVDIGLFVAGLFVSGGWSLALMAGSAAVGAGGAAMNIEEALDRLTMANTHLDESQALASDSTAREAMFWAAIEGALVVMDGIGTLEAPGEVRAARKAVQAHLDLAQANDDSLRMSVDDMAKKDPTVASGTTLVDGTGKPHGEMDITIGSRGFIVEDKSAAGLKTLLGLAYFAHPDVREAMGTRRTCGSAGDAMPREEWS